MYLRTGADSHSTDCWVIAWIHAHSYVRNMVVLLTVIQGYKEFLHYIVTDDVQPLLQMILSPPQEPSR